MLSLNKKISIYLLLFTSVIVSYLLGENSSGGSQHDYLSTKKYIDTFQIDFYEGMKLFKESSELHLPFFYLIIGNISKIIGINVLHYLYLIISSLIPYVFYKVLKKKFTDANYDVLFFLSIIIFLSPYFRSSAVWLTTDNLALLFFLLSINYFFKIEFQNKVFLINALLCFFYLVLASYIRHYYGIFFIFYFYIIYSKFDFYKNILIVLFNIVLSVPFILYINYISLDKNFSESFWFVNFNFTFNTLFFTSLFLFYFFPFILNNFSLRYVGLNFLSKKNIIILLLIIFSLIFITYDIPINQIGGGIFYKISMLYNINLFFIFALIGSLVLFFFTENLFRNYLMFLILIIIFPLSILFQKYYDPLIYILIFTLISSKFIDDLIISKEINLYLIGSYYLLFLISCNFYYF